MPRDGALGGQTPATPRRRTRDDDDGHAGFHFVKSLAFRRKSPAYSLRPPMAPPRQGGGAGFRESCHVDAGALIRSGVASHSAPSVP
jgi:hypothetical protein